MAIFTVENRYTWPLQKAVASEKLQVAQRFLTMKFWVPSNWKKYVFPVIQRQKLVTYGNWVLLEHSPDTIKL